MVQKAHILDIDTALAKLIWSGIKNDPENKKIISSQDQISFSLPKTSETEETRKLSIFLYNIKEEVPVRNEPFALSYLVTPFNGSDKDDHELLGKIIQVFLANPIIVDEKSDVNFAVKMDSFSLEELSKLWVALGAPLRLSVSVTVSLTTPQVGKATEVTAVTAAPQTTEDENKQISHLYQAVLKTFTEQTNGWRSRNFVFKRWSFQNFEKDTGVSVEEMLFVLEDLGGKLEKHESTDDFIENLNQLAHYYEHQLEALRGMQKVLHKQAENLELVAVWISEVKALLEALRSLNYT